MLVRSADLILDRFIYLLTQAALALAARLSSRMILKKLNGLHCAANNAVFIKTNLGDVVVVLSCKFANSPVPMMRRKIVALHAMNSVCLVAVSLTITRKRPRTC
jgi:hypothetical protein